VLSRLSPCLESNEELAFTLSVLMTIIADYAAQLRHTLNGLPLTRHTYAAAVQALMAYGT
jgi:hypothetical protein